jgi:two-component system sensor histidine kinase/response regulator
MLRHWGCTVIKAYSGEQAITKMTLSATAGEVFDFLVIDWRMPGMDGYGLIKRIQELFDQKKLQTIPPVLMVTEAERAEFVESRDYRDDIMVLIKPVTVSRLLNTLSELELIELITEDLVNGKRITLETQLKTALAQMNSHPRILLVEDNLTNQIVIREILAAYPLQIEVANNGAEAVALLEKAAFDLVLMDLQMPVMDGFEATKRIRRFKPSGSLPILALSAATFVDDIHKSELAGMDDHLQKPIDIELLLAALLKWLPFR